MALQQEAGKVVGNNDQSISPYLKIWISQGDVTVCGVIGEGTSKEIQANWDSPFEGESAGSKAQLISGFVQAKTDATSITTINSRQIWGGNRPTQFNVVLRLYALSDPQKEVRDALMELEKMIAPQVNSVEPISVSGVVKGGQILGRIPGVVIINIGRNNIYPDCVLESISEPLDTEKDKNGLLIRCDVNLSISTVQMLNKSDIASKYG